MHQVETFNILFRRIHFRACSQFTQVGYLEKVSAQNVRGRREELLPFLAQFSHLRNGGSRALLMSS